MILYHGSQNKFDVLKRNQAEKGDDIVVPESELQDAIYLSPNRAFALAMCSMPKGLTHVDHDKMTIETEFPESFDPNMKIYVYAIDSEKIPKEQLEFLTDGMQVVCHTDELQYESVEELTASEVLNYYKLLNYENPEGVKAEIKSEFKLR
jgi:hypothetical protein